MNVIRTGGGAAWGFQAKEQEQRLGNGNEQGVLEVSGETGEVSSPGYQQPPSWPMANTHPFPPQQGPVSESVGLARGRGGGAVGKPG